MAEVVCQSHGIHYFVSINKFRFSVFVVSSIFGFSEYTVFEFIAADGFWWIVCEYYKLNNELYTIESGEVAEECF